VKNREVRYNQFFYIVFLGLCSCAGCDIEVSGVELSKDNLDVQVVDISTGKCLVNEIESELTPKQEGRLTAILMEKLPTLFADSVILINKVPSSKINREMFNGSIDVLLDTLRRNTSFTYYLQVWVRDGETRDLNSHIRVGIEMYDLDTGNLIYSQSVSGIETDPEYDPDATSTFTFGRSSFSMIKRALNMGLSDLEKASAKYRKTPMQPGSIKK
jgi:hypothetical protein